MKIKITTYSWIFAFYTHSHAKRKFETSKNHLQQAAAVVGATSSSRPCLLLTAEGWAEAWINRQTFFFSFLPSLFDFFTNLDGETSHSLRTRLIPAEIGIWITLERFTCQPATKRRSFLPSLIIFAHGQRTRRRLQISTLLAAALRVRQTTTVKKKNHANVFFSLYWWQTQMTLWKRRRCMATLPTRRNGKIRKFDSIIHTEKKIYLNFQFTQN